MSIEEGREPLRWIVWAIALGALAWQWWRVYRRPRALAWMPRAPFWLAAAAWVLLGLLFAAERPVSPLARTVAWALPGLGLAAAALIRLIRVDVPRLVAEESEPGGEALPGEEGPAELDLEDRRLVLRLVALRRRLAAELMLPLPRVASLQAGATVADALALLRARGHWRIPVIDPAGPRALGVIESRDLVREALAEAEGRLAPEQAREDLRHRCHPIPEVQATRTAADLVAALRADGHGLVAVVDRERRLLGFAAWDHVFQALVGRRGEEVGL